MSAPANGSVRELLEVVEAHLAAPAESVSAAEHDRAVQALAEALAALEAAVADSPGEAAALAARLRRVRSLGALRTRQVPDGALEGVYEAVRARMEGLEDDAGDRALLRAGLSRSFLDAPRALALWRRTAVAAVTLMALGLGVWATATGDGEAGSARTAGEPLAPYDPRDDLLHRLTPASFGQPAGVPDGRVVPMNNERRGPRVYFLRGGAGRSADELWRMLRVRSSPDLPPVEQN